MKIGLISDTHNEQHKVRHALAAFQQEGIKTLLHAGDITNVATLKRFAGFDAWIARGNMDRDYRLLPTAKQLFGRGRLAMSHTLALDGVNIALLHGDNWSQLETFIKSGHYAYVVHGHTHVPQDESVGTTRILNPGALSHPRAQRLTCATLDLANGHVTWIEL